VTVKPTYFKILLATLISVVMIPTAIVVATLALDSANESTGWLCYRLPVMFFWIFLTTGVISPFLGMGTLILLWTLQRHSASVEGQLKVTRALVFAALTATVAPAAWVFVFSEVFFVSGGSR
jgi:hypothetical protein